MVKQELGVEKPDAPRDDLAYGGNWLPGWVAFRLWREHHLHHNLPFRGGYLDQPPEVERSFDTLNELHAAITYYTREEYGLDDKDKA